MRAIEDVQAAAGRIAGRITPAPPSHAVSLATGAHTTLKLENRRAIGSAMARGATGVAHQRLSAAPAENDTVRRA